MSLMSAHRFQHLLLLFFLTCIQFLTATTSDEAALIAFKSQITTDPHDVFKSWNTTLHFCKWEGITCGRRHKRVTVLDLNSRNLVGHLSPYTANLSFLRVLSLYNNSFQGHIPPQFGNLLRLESLFLHNNSLVGEIPANLSHCTRLREFWLGSNNLVGKIPPQFGSFRNLRELTLISNNLSGGIPSFISNLTSLELLVIGKNPLGGSIPESLGQLRRLTWLILSFNDLSGTIPFSIFNLTSLTYLHLGGNHLTGSLPSDFGLVNLEFLQLSQNLLTGPVPVSLSNCSKLNTLQMIENSFSGKLSVDFGHMQNLRNLGLGRNSLGSREADEMKFVDSLANCTYLKVLILDHNRFSGILPHSIANLTSVEEFYFGENQLHGNIPPGITKLTNLKLLSLYRNQITGSIPDDIGRLYNLRILSLSDNQLSGGISSSLRNLSFLLILELGNNRISGTIPSSLGDLKQLAELHLYQNNLTGNIPKQLFDLTSLSVVLDLSHNHLVGPIPPGVGNLKTLTKFDVSDNNFSGEIPNDVGRCVSLEYLYMQDNLFQGSIPKTLETLKGLRKVDLSGNNLSGKIPIWLQNFQLEKLNLSFNHFEGEVPRNGVFANSSAISLVGNSNSLCGGIIELKLPKCPNAISKKHKKRLLVFKILISAVAGVFCLAVLLFAIFCFLSRRRNQHTSDSEPTWSKTLPKVSYELLLKATEGFSPSHLIGTGSFGTVYKGILNQDGRTVIAIKVLNLHRHGASKSFKAECQALKTIRHRNLLKVITSCSSIDFQGNDFRAIVYEFMENGSLEKWLHQVSGQPPRLTLLQRLNILIDVALALDYLHNQCHEPIIHCDLKPSNVLLSNDMTAHVGDFGLVKFLPENLNSEGNISITGIKGTVGYTPPGNHSFLVF